MNKSKKITTSNMNEGDKTKKINIDWVHEDKSIPKEKLQLSESGIDFLPVFLKMLYMKINQIKSYKTMINSK